MTDAFRIELLDPDLDRSGFHSGSPLLDRYFREQVTQDARRRVTACFVALTPEHRVAGYYTLASASVPLNDLPPELGKRLPRYPSVPAVRMGRLAVDEGFRRRGLGAVLLADALLRSRRAEIAAYALIVDAKDEEAAAFYHHHGFVPFRQPLTTRGPALAATRVPLFPCADALGPRHRRAVPGS